MTPFNQVEGERTSNSGKRSGTLGRPSEDNLPYFLAYLLGAETGPLSFDQKATLESSRHIRSVSLERSPLRFRSSGFGVLTWNCCATTLQVLQIVSVACWCAISS